MSICVQCIWGIALGLLCLVIPFMAVLVSEGYIRYFIFKNAGFPQKIKSIIPKQCEDGKYHLGIMYLYLKDNSCGYQFGYATEFNKIPHVS